MVDSFKKFTRGFTTFSVIILLISLSIYLWVPSIRITPAFPYIVLFYYALTMLIFRMLDNAKKKKTSKFANTYMLTNFGKLILFTVIIFVYAYYNRIDAIPFIITFFIYYLLFTTYEVIALINKQAYKK